MSDQIRRGWTKNSLEPGDTVTVNGESGHGGHLTVRLGNKKSTLPMHGKNKELGAGLVNAVKKDLGLK